MCLVRTARQRDGDRTSPRGPAPPEGAQECSRQGERPPRHRSTGHRSTGHRSTGHRSVHRGSGRIRSARERLRGRCRSRPDRPDGSSSPGRPNRTGRQPAPACADSSPGQHGPGSRREVVATTGNARRSAGPAADGHRSADRGPAGRRSAGPAEGDRRSAGPAENDHRSVKSGGAAATHPSAAPNPTRARSTGPRCSAPPYQPYQPCRPRHRCRAAPGSRSPAWENHPSDRAAAAHRSSARSAPVAAPGRTCSDEAAGSRCIRPVRRRGPARPKARGAPRDVPDRPTEERSFQWRG
ncbi:LigA [Parafrankia sp. EUN1f]|nr:LigA [Parafrankia sp. EUN1f]